MEKNTIKLLNDYIYYCEYWMKYSNNDFTETIKEIKNHIKKIEK